MKNSLLFFLALSLLTNCNPLSISDFEFLKENREAYDKVGNLANKLSKLKYIYEKNQPLYKYLENNNITSNSDIQKCTKLDLRDLGMEELYGIEFFENLKSLNLSNNKLTKVGLYTQEITGLTKLERLDLSNNNIHDIYALHNLLTPRKVIDYFPSNGDKKQITVPLRSTFDSSVDTVRSVKIIPSIRYLNVKGNPLDDISIFWKDKNFITTDSLLFDKTGFENTIILFENYPELYENSNLYYKKLNDETLKNIKHLGVKSKSSKITKCIEGLKLCPKLQTLKIKINELYLKNKDEIFIAEKLNFFNLKISNLEVFCFEKLPDFLVNWLISKMEFPEKITSLKIADSKVTNFSIFKRFQNLQTLCLNNNGIKGLNSFPYLPQLETLNLSRNKIEELNGIKPNNLKYLDLSFNKIRFLPEMSIFKKLEQLDLRKNNLSMSENNLCKLNTLPVIQAIHFNYVISDNLSDLAPLTRRDYKIKGLDYDKIEMDLLKVQFLKYKYNRTLSQKFIDKLPYSDYRKRKKELFG